MESPAISVRSVLDVLAHFWESPPGFVGDGGLVPLLSSRAGLASKWCMLSQSNPIDRDESGRELHIFFYRIVKGGTMSSW